MSSSSSPVTFTLPSIFYSVTCFRSRFLPGRAKDLSAPEYYCIMYLLNQNDSAELLFTSLPVSDRWRFGTFLKEKYFPPYCIIVLNSIKPEQRHPNVCGSCSKVIPLLRHLCHLNPITFSTILIQRLLPHSNINRFFFPFTARSFLWAPGTTFSTKGSTTPFLTSLKSNYQRSLFFLLLFPLSCWAVQNAVPLFVASSIILYICYG
jgi:hypothetical protein